MSAIRSRLPVLGLLATLFATMPAGAQSAAEREIEAARERVRALRQEAEALQERIAAAEERRRQDRGAETEEILQGLRQGMAALRALGAMDALEQLERIAVEVEQRRERGQREDRPGLRDNDIEVMRLAIRGLAEAERIEAAEILERAIEVDDALRYASTDREIARLREVAPSRGNQIEALLLATRVFEEFEQPDRAEIIGRYARELMGQADRRREGADRRGEETEIQAARRQLDVMRIALRALQDSDASDARELLEHAMHVRELALEGQPYEGERPSRGNQAEVMMLAAEMLADRGQEERAAAVSEYARQLADQARRLRDAPRRETEVRGGDADNQIRRLEGRLEELAAAMRELQAAVRELRRGRDRD